MALDRLFSKLQRWVWLFLKRRIERFTLASMLHRSNAWHCGCGSCVVKRTGQRKVLGVVIETWHVTDAERARLQGRDRVE